MKKLAISVVTMITASSFGLAQNSHSEFELSTFKDLGSITSNYDYLNEVQNVLTPSQVKYLENLASYWDVKKSDKFDGRSGEPFIVTFRSKDGQIVASYNNNGNIVSATERFSDVTLPKPVVIEILRQHPGWDIVKNKYSITYNRDIITKRIFKIQIQKGKQRKWLKVDQDGGLS